MDLKERIKELCKINGVSMNKVESDLNFGKGYISKLGKSTPNANKIRQIADYFNVTVDYLMSGKEADFIINLNDKEKILLESYRQLDVNSRERLEQYIEKLSDLCRLEYDTKNNVDNE